MPYLPLILSILTALALALAVYLASTAPTGFEGP